MIFDEHLYAEAREAKLGQRTLPPPFEGLRRWISETYGINVLYLAYDQVGIYKIRPRLRIIVDTAEDLQKVSEDPFTIKPRVKAAVLEKLSEALAEEPVTNPEDTLLFFDDFSAKAMRRAFSLFCQRDRQQVMDELSKCHIWNISDGAGPLVVFYGTTKDVQRNAHNGCSDNVKQRCFELVKKYDEFGYCRFDNFAVKFDSQENVDRNYAGSLLNYFR